MDWCCLNSVGLTLEQVVYSVVASGVYVPLFIITASPSCNNSSQLILCYNMGTALSPAAETGIVFLLLKHLSVPLEGDTWFPLESR